MVSRESGIYRLIAFSERHATIVIIVTLVITLVLGYFAVQVDINSRIMDLLPEDAEVTQLLKKYGQSEEPFEYLIIAVEGPDIFSMDALQALERMTKEVESLEHIELVTSPFSQISFSMQGKRLRILPLGPDGRAPQTNAEVTTFRERIATSELAKNLVVSGDLTSLSSIFTVDLLDDYDDLFDTFYDILSEYEDYFTIYAASSAIFEHLSHQYLIRDLPTLLIAAVFLFLILYLVGFRTVRGVVLPLLVFAIGSVWTLGFMRLFGFSLTLVSVMTPPLVVILGSSYSIHALNQYYREAPAALKRAGDNRNWIADSIFHVTATILLAALTTIIGFCSLLVTELDQVHDFGFSVSIGIASCALLSLFFFPAVLSKLRVPTQEQGAVITEGVFTRLMERIGDAVPKIRFFAVGFAILVTVGFLVGFRYIRYQTDYIGYFKPRERSVVASNYIFEKYGGFLTINITLTAPSGNENYFLDTEVLKMVSEFEEKAKENPDIVDITSFTGYLKLLNQTAKGVYQVPERRPLILLLSRFLHGFSSGMPGMNPDMIINEDYTQMTMVLRVYDHSRKSALMESRFQSMLDRLDELQEEILYPEIKVETWGLTLVGTYLSSVLSRDQFISSLISVVLIFIVAAIAFRSVGYGVLALTPMLTGIMLNFVIMWLANIPLDVVTATFTSIVIGLGVDQAIHFIIQFRRQSAKKDHDHSINSIIRETLKTAGRPITISAAALITGFLVFLFSSFKPIMYFGVLIAMAIFTTSIGTLLLLPSILSIFHQIRFRRGGPGKRGEK